MRESSLRGGQGVAVRRVEARCLPVFGSKTNVGMPTRALGSRRSRCLSSKSPADDPLGSSQTDTNSKLSWRWM